MLLVVIGIGFKKGEDASASFKYKDYLLKKTVEYTGDSLSFFVDGNIVDLSEQPSMLSERQIAYASAKALFGDMIGARVKYSKKNRRISITYNGHLLRLYVGSTKAEFDGEPVEAPCAPMKIKYKSSKVIAYMVPSRFVSELFGFNYNWNESEKAISIRIPLTIEINGTTGDYLGTKGKLYFEGDLINQEGTCSLIFDNTAMINADSSIFDEAIVDYDYDEDTGIIELESDGRNILYCIGSRISYVDGLLARNPHAPMIVGFPDLDEEFVYVPGRFSFENLGMYYYWNVDTGSSEIWFSDPDAEIDEDTEIEYNDGHGDGYDDDESFDKDTSYLGDESNDLRLVNVYNTTEGYKFFVDYDNCEQRLTIDLPMIDDVGDIEMREDILSCLNELVIQGNCTEYFKDYEIENTGEAILQIQVYYDPVANETLIRFYSDCVMGCEIEDFTNGKTTLHFDYVKNIYKKVIVIDAGHGGHDPGAVSYGYEEAALNLKVVQNVKELLKDTGIKAYFTRLDDIYLDLHVRADFAGLVGADMFISVHHNSANTSSACGTCVYYGGLDTYTSLNGLTSAELAYRMEEALLEKLETERFSTGIIDKNFVVVRDSEAPAILIEVGFMSNKAECERMAKDKFSKKVAAAIVETVVDIYNVAE